MTSHDNVTDIEARLRRNSGHCSGHEPSLSLLQRTAEEAADTIATLRKQLENALEALAWYADQMCEGWCDKDPSACEAIGSENCAGCPARIALKGKS